MKTQLQNILEKQIDRRDFLKYVGSALLAVIGIGNLLRILSHREGNTRQRDVHTFGYGAGPYGGRKRG